MKLTVGSLLVLLGTCLGEDQASNLQQEAQKGMRRRATAYAYHCLEVVIEAVDNCPLGAGRCGGGGGVAGNQYARGQMDNGAYRMGQFAGQGNFGAIDSTAFAANNPYGSGGQMRAPPNMFYGSQFINQVQQCPPGANCAGQQQPAFPAGQAMQMPADQGQMVPQDQGQMPPQDQAQGDMMQDGSMPQQDGSMPIGDASQQKQRFDQYQQQQQQQQYEQAQQQQRYGQFQQQQQPFCAGAAGGMGMGAGPSYGMPVGGPSYGMPGGGPAYGMPGNIYMNMMPQMGPYGGQFAMGGPPCAGAGQGPWMNYGRGGYGRPVNMQQIYG